MKIAILTSPDQWFIPYAKTLQNKLVGSELLYNHTDITKEYDIVYVLSYH